jgi:hypothetical protein
MCDVSGRFDGFWDLNNPNIRDLNDTGDDYDTDEGKHTFSRSMGAKTNTGQLCHSF